MGEKRTSGVVDRVMDGDPLRLARALYSSESDVALVVNWREKCLSVAVKSRC